MNFMGGVIGESGSVQVPALQRDVATGVGGAVGSKVSFGLRPEHITIDPAGSTHKVDMTESLGGISYAYLVGETGERMIVEERGDERSREGDVVGLSFEDNRSYVFDAASEMRIR
jgi:lactose/L-arabinose transport system ATP-binding protein